MDSTNIDCSRAVMLPVPRWLLLFPFWLILRVQWPLSLLLCLVREVRLFWRGFLLPFTIGHGVLLDISLVLAVLIEHV